MLRCQGEAPARGQAYVRGMNRALRLWSAVSWWLVPLAILVFGAVDLAQNGIQAAGGAS